MSGSLNNGELRIRETYNSFCRAMFLLCAVMFAVCGVIAGYGVAELYSSGESDLAMAILALLAVLCLCCAVGILRQYLELRIDDNRVAARAWPFPWTVVPIDQILTSEVVQVDPRRDYGGWGFKGLAQDRLIGGGGTTALRITYTHESGEKRKLTFLTDRADEALQRIALQRTR